MFGFFKRWRQRRSLRRRTLFRFSDNLQTRYADPLAVWRSIRTYPDFDGTSETQLAFVDAGQEPESSRCCVMIAEVFQVERFDSRTNIHGLTDAELLDLFGSFTLYLDQIKKNTDPLRTSSSPLETPPSAAGQTSPTPATS